MTTTAKLPPYPRYIVNAVCARRRVPVEHVLWSGRGDRDVSWARYEIWATLVRGRAEGFDLHNPYSAAAVAKMFGRDHSSIQHGVRRFTDRPPIPSKRSRVQVHASDPCPPPQGCCYPLTPGVPPPGYVIPAPVSRAAMTPEEARVERNRRKRELYRAHRTPRPVGAGDRFWLRSLADQRAGAGHEHVRPLGQ